MTTQHPAASASLDLDRDAIRAIFMKHGFTIKEGQADLKPYVYEAADALIALARRATHQPSEADERVPVSPQSVSDERKAFDAYWDSLDDAGATDAELDMCEFAAWQAWQARPRRCLALTHRATTAICQPATLTDQPGGATCQPRATTAEQQAVEPIARVTRVFGAERAEVMGYQQGALQVNMPLYTAPAATTASPLSDEEAYAQSGYRHFMSFDKFKAFRADCARSAAATASASGCCTNAGCPGCFDPAEVAAELRATAPSREAAPGENAMMKAWSLYIIELETKLARLEAVLAQQSAAPGDLTTVPCPSCDGKSACDDCTGQGRIIVSRADLAAQAQAGEGDAKDGALSRAEIGILRFAAEALEGLDYEDTAGDLRTIADRAAMFAAGQEGGAA